MRDSNVLSIQDTILSIFNQVSVIDNFSLSDAITRVSCETSFDSKQPKLEPKLVSNISET
jgi:hypothetical protein